MVVKKNHLWAAAILAVLAVAYFAQRAENSSRDLRDREDSVASCVRSVARDAYLAAGYAVLSERVAARGGPGDERSAQQYRAVSVSVLRSLPKPANLSNPERMLGVDLIQDPEGELRYALTEDAKRLQEEGCRQAFG